jgi:hypothetical protein
VVEWDAAFCVSLNRLPLKPIIRSTPFYATKNNLTVLQDLVVSLVLLLLKRSPLLAGRAVVILYQL